MLIPFPVIFKDSSPMDESESVVIFRWRCLRCVRLCVLLSPSSVGALGEVLLSGSDDEFLELQSFSHSKSVKPSLKVKEA